MKNPPLSLLFVYLVLFFPSCSKDAEETTETQTKSDAKEILSFKVNIEGTEHVAQIEGTSITYMFSSNTELDDLAPVISISEKATITPKSGEAQDFSKEVAYTVTAENGTTKKFIVSLEKEEMGSGKTILTFGFTNLAEGQASYEWIKGNETENDTLVHFVPYLSPIKGLTSRITISDGASIEPESGATLDYTRPVNYTVTAQDGSIKNYVILVDNSLDKVKLVDFSAFDLQKTEPGATFNFKISPATITQDSIKVNLIDEKQNSEGLAVEGLDTTTGTVVIRLPQTFPIGSYNLEVFIEHDNSIISNGFKLFKGTPNVQYVEPYVLENGTALKQTFLYAPNEVFKMSLNLNLLDKDFEDHQFYLKKGTTKIPLDERPNWLDTERFILPDLAELGIEGGTDFKFGFEVDGQSYEADLVNIDGEPIEIIATEPPVINSISSGTVVQKKTITVNGQNLFFNVSPGADDFYDFGKNSRIMLIDEGTFDPDKEYSILPVSNAIIADTNTATEAVFTIPEYHPTGSFSLIFNNSLNHGANSDWVDTGFTVDVSQPASEHPTLNIVETTFSKFLATPQIQIKFDGNIENVDIERIEVNRHFYPDIVIGNFFTFPTSILTGDLSEERNNIILGTQGKVILNDNGVVYELYFQIDDIVN